MPDERHDEYRCDGRGQVGRYGLDVEEQLGVLEAQDHWDPQDAHGNQHEDGTPVDAGKKVIPFFD